MVNMDKDNFIDIVFNSFNEDNLKMCKQSGMTEDEAYAKMNESAPSLLFLLSNAYDKLIEAKVL